MAQAQQRALAAIEDLRQQRLAEGRSEAELTMLHVLAEQTIVQRLAEEGPMDAATHWFTNVLKPIKAHKVEGGPHIGKVM